MAKKILPRRRQKPAQPVTNGIKVELFPELRQRLFQAAGVVHAVRVALDCHDHIQTNDAQLASALEAAGVLVDYVAGMLEPQQGGRSHG